MIKFNFVKTPLEGMYTIEPTVFYDDRGYFMETFNRNDFIQAGIDISILQQNQSISVKGVLRGLHFQKQKQQAKLVRVIHGKVFDVGVDLRMGSPTFGKWYGTVLSDENNRMCYIPKGFAHGFLTLSDEAIFTYGCTDFYDSEDEDGILWNDTTLAIEWPVERDMKIILSEKDANQQTFKEYIKAMGLK